VWKSKLIALAEDYSYALVATPDRKYLWMLSRSPYLDEGVFQQLVERAKEQGFGVSRLQRTRQSGVSPVSCCSNSLPLAACN
jgi:apolipoprotein D and lipocalin family protein